MYDTDEESSQTSDEESNSSNELSSDTDESDSSGYSDSERETSDLSEEEESSSSDDEDETDSEISVSPYTINVKPTDVPKLEEMACNTIAVALWNREISQLSGGTHVLEWYLISEYQIPERTDELFVPKLLSKRIENRSRKILSSLRNWVSYHFREIYFKCRSSIRYHFPGSSFKWYFRETESRLYLRINSIAWNSNGTINCKKTAENLLESEELTNEEKYRFACTYCLVQDIERIWPSIEKHYNLDEYWFGKHPLMYYWNHYCSNNFDGILPLLRNLPIDEFMIKHRYVDNWPAKEYFFDLLSVEDQVINAIWLIDYGRIDYQKMVLLKLNESQLLHVYSEKSVEIISNYVCTGDNDEDAISVWYKVRDLITQEEFLSLCKKLIGRGRDDFVLTKIWTSARDKFKRYVLIYKNYYFIRKALQSYERRKVNGKEICIDFLATVLLDNTCLIIKRDITLKRFFIDFCKTCILKGKFELLNRLIKICLPEANERMRFKYTLLKIAKKRCKKFITYGQIKNSVRLLNFYVPETHPKSMETVCDILQFNLKDLDDQCLTHYSTGNLKELNDFLSPIASSYPEIVLDYKSNLLISENGINACINHFSSNTGKLAAIVADGFLPNSKLAFDFKRSVIFADENIDKLHNFIFNGRWNNVRRFVRWFLKSNKDKKKLKARLIHRLKKQIGRIDPQTRKKYLEF